MTDSARKGEAMEIETEKKMEHVTPNKDPDVFHLGEKEALSNSKYLQRIKTQRIVDNKRLIIHKITLENFKSYAGVREIGPFHKSFTSIVGPNGSGKSNLIDALLFIFGKRAKAMRLNKLAELIHNSKAHQNLPKASVQVTFREIIDKDNDEDYDLVEGTEFSIKRTVLASSTSKYEINNREVTQAEVVNLLKSKGIDLDNNRFLILQGEVEQISLMKPKTNDPNDPGLLEYLEDIVGSNKYKEQIDTSELELDKTNDQRKEKVERVRISETDLLKLDDAKNTAVDFVKKEKQGYQLMNIQYQIERFKANEEVTKCENEVTELDTKLKAEKKKQKDKVKDNEGFLKTFNELRRDIEANQKTSSDCQKKYEALNIRDSKVQAEQKFNLQHEVKNRQRLDELEKEYQKVIETTAEIEAELPVKEKQLRELQKEKEKEEERFNDMTYKLRGQTEKLRKKREGIVQELNPHEKKFTEIKNRLEELKNEFELSKKKKEITEGEVGKVEEDIESINKTLDELKTYHVQIEDALQRIAELSKEHRNKINEYKRQEDDLTNEAHEINSRLEEIKQTSGQARIQNQIINSLLGAQKRRELHGIAGRLGDLGAIDEAYDIAVSTACPQLDNIVVNRYDEAQKCVEYLRQQRIGRATFIALDKIGWVKEQMQRPFRAPANSERLFDLIHFKDENLRMAFYFVLRDTLVCRDIDTATNIAYGTVRHRVVTLKGELIDTSGTMSGGGKPKRGGMGAKLKEEASDDQINQLVEKSHSINRKIEDLRRTRAETEKAMNVVIYDETQAKQERQKVLMDTDFNSQQLKEAKQKLEELNRILKNKANDEKAQKDLEKKIIQLDEELNDVKETCEKYRKKIQGIDDEIEDIGGKELKDQKRKVDTINQKHDDLEKEVAKMQAQVTNVVKNLNKNKKEQLEVKEKLEKTKKTLEKLKEEANDLEEEGMKILALMKACEEKKSELEKKFNEFDKENDKIKKIMNELRTSIDAITAEKDEKNKILKKAKDEYNTAQKNLEANRKKYQEIIGAYDFLDIIDEIAQFNVQDLNNPKARNGDDDEDIEEEGGARGDDEEEVKPSRIKKIKINFDPEVVYAVEVFQDLTLSQLETMNKYYQDIKLKHAQLTEKIKEMQPNITSIQAYKERFVEHKKRMKELDEIRNLAKTLKQNIDTLKKKRFDEFMSGFNLIGAKLKETYQILTLGGDAELELIDSLDPFSEGVIFSVRPPKKSWKQMSKLSGGEKTLSSLALVFALHYYKPTPLYFMDEIDAALDYKNVAIVGNFVKEKTKNAQFIIISLRNNMFELADKLVGVYKTADTTKTITINPYRIEKAIKEELS